MGNGYLWIDGFDNYSTPSIAYETTSGSPTIGTAYRRFAPPSPLTGQGLNCAQNNWVRKNLPSSPATIVVCWAGLQTALPSVNQDWIMQVLDTGNCQVSLAITSAGAMQFYRGALGTAIYNATAAGVIVPNVWHGFVAQITISTTVGQVILWMDGTQLLSSSANLNTQSTGNASVNQVQLGRGNVASGGQQIDDIVFMDAVGNWFNGSVGNDGRLFTKMPSAAGALTNWTPIGNANNYACCNEIPPDNDTTYVTSAGAGAQDAYTMQAISLTVAPYGFVSRSYVRKDDASAHTFKNGARSAAANGLSSAATLSSSYAWYDSPLQNDPNTSAPWAGAAADAAQVLKEATT